jgi:hypothetical protein
MRLAQITNIPSPATRFPDHATLLGSLVSRILIFSIGFAGLVFLVQLIVSGFGLMTAAGDPGKVQSAQKGLTSGLIGLIVVISAFFLIQILTGILGLNIDLTN